MRDGLIRRLGGFLAAGSVGFIVDAGLTETCVALGLNPYAARVVAVAAAIATTYVINRFFTWRRSATQTQGGRRKARYLAVSLASMAINYAVYAMAVATFAGIRPALAVAFGSAVGMVSNYFGYSRLVFGASDKNDQAA